MYVRIGQAGHDPAAARVDDGGVLQINFWFDRRDLTIAQQNVILAVNRARGIDHAASSEQDRLQCAASGSFIGSTIE